MWTCEERGKEAETRPRSTPALVSAGLTTVVFRGGDGDGNLPGAAAVAEAATAAALASAGRPTAAATFSASDESQFAQLAAYVTTLSSGFDAVGHWAHIEVTLF